ncbi:hypothetical protein ACFL2C_04285, partial [Patescibacteria group bacterium]
AKNNEESTRETVQASGETNDVSLQEQKAIVTIKTVNTGPAYSGPPYRTQEVEISGTGLKTKWWRPDKHAWTDDAMCDVVDRAIGDSENSRYKVLTWNIGKVTPAEEENK